MQLPQNIVLRWCVYGAVLGAIMSVLYAVGMMETKPYPWEGEGMIANVSYMGGQIVGGAFFVGLIGMLIGGMRRMKKP